MTVKSNGVTLTKFEVKNQSQSMMACLLQIQGENSPILIAVRARKNAVTFLPVQQTNSISLDVKVLRLTPAHQYTGAIP